MKLSALTAQEVTNTLNTRGYFAQPVSPAVSLTVSPSVSPTSRYLTHAEVLSTAVTLALQTYGYTGKASTSTYITGSTFTSIVNYAVSKAPDIEKYMTTAAEGQIPGLLGQVTTTQSWGSQWGPVILQMVGAAATIAGNYWQAQEQRNLYEQQYKAMTGTALPTANSQDADVIAKYLMTQNPSLTYNQALQIAKGYSGLPYTETTKKEEGLPSWVLPAALVGVPVIILLARK